MHDCKQEEVIGTLKAEIKFLNDRKIPNGYVRWWQIVSVIVVLVLSFGGSLLMIGKDKAQAHDKMNDARVKADEAIIQMVTDNYRVLSDKIDTYNIKTTERLTSIETILKTKK